jgi:hypothetical protein
VSSEDLEVQNSQVSSQKDEKRRIGFSETIFWDSRKYVVNFEN